MGKKKATAEQDTVKVEYVGPHSPATNRISGTWEHGMVKDLPRDIADQLTANPNFFKIHKEG